MKRFALIKLRWSASKKKKNQPSQPQLPSYSLGSEVNRTKSCSLGWGIKLEREKTNDMKIEMKFLPQFNSKN